MARLSLSPTKLWSCVLLCGLLASACGGAQSPFTSLTTNDPIAQIAEGLTLSVNPAALAGDFGARLQAISAAAFANRQAGPRWEAALAALPAHLQPRGPLFEIETTGTPPEEVFLSVILPSGVDLAVLDLYTWDDETWSFVPAQVRGGQLVANVSHIPSTLGLFEARPVPPLALTTVEPGETLGLEASAAINAALLGGVTVQEDGSLAGQMPAVAAGEARARYPVIRDHDAAGLKTRAVQSVLGDAAVRANHMQTLVAFVVSSGYDGLVIDFLSVDPTQRSAFTQFVSELRGQLNAQGKAVLVKVPAPALAGGADGAYAAGGYDWRGLGAAADALVLPVFDDPTAMGSGATDALLAWAVGEVERSRLLLLTSALSVHCAGTCAAGAAGQFSLADEATALTPLGSVALAPDSESTPYAGQPITLTLSGRAESLSYDAAAFAARYDYTDEAGSPHTVWVTSPDTLRHRLALAEKYRLGGVVVADLPRASAAEAFAAAVTEYKVNLAAAAAQTGPVDLTWTVTGGTGVLSQATAQPGQPYVYVAEAPGEYQFAADLRYGGTASLGSLVVSVAQAPTATPPPVAIVGGGSTGASSGSGATSGGGSTGSSGGSTSGGFVPPPPVAGGPFELGGQVPGYIGHPAEMKQAGMRWVKFQATGDAGGLIAAGHAAGFKVLLSAVGDRARATDPSYWPQYASWVAGLAGQGADAIEVWNEANIDREWPKGQISGATYTELLKQAYNAIKGANSGTLVISGAPAPTGAEAAFPGSVVNDDNFLRQMAAAGAASYMDCVGVHYNTGTTSPHATSGSALSGYHYSYYFWPMVDLYYNVFGGSRPLCFTELGYVSPQGFEAVPLPANFGWAAGITVAQQAQWLAEAASLSASSGKVRMMIVFNVDFTVYFSNDPQAGYAMIRPDGSCPACAALDAVMP